ncbi:MAG: TlpA disulfide reductase family protein [Kofleriaceae bacterium]
MWTQVAIVVSLAILAGGACKNSLPVPDGDLAAELAIPTTEDRVFDPATLRGKPALVVFARSGCPYCTNELPAAQRAGAATNANVVAVYLWSGKEAALEVTKAAGFTQPVLIDDGRLGHKLAIRAVPYTVVLGADGRARQAFRGEQSEATLREALADARD